MKICKDAVRELQKNGIYKFEGLTREMSKAAASSLAKAAIAYDKKYGIESAFGIGRDAFGYYYAAQVQ